MKKRLITFIAIIMSVLMSFAGLSGCNLVTSNVERDLNQVIATVEVTKKENIYKKDLIMGYLNYGYVYVQYYGYDAAKTYNMILNNLIDNRILVQVAYKAFENGDTDAGIDKRVENESAEVYTPERYLNETEITAAKYDAYKSINDLLDSYSEDNSKTEKKDALIFDVRTVPTDSQNAEKEVADAKKAEYVADIDENGFDVTGEYKRAAFNKVIKLLKDNDLLGKKYEGDLKETEYFRLLLTSNYESQVIQNYEDEILAGIKSDLKYDALQALYAERFNAQNEWTNADFVSAFSSADASKPVLYSAFGTYGYVYNLLLGVNDYQSAEISELQEERVHESWAENKYAEERAKVLAGTIAKDLRSSWILAGYDFDYETNKFTGDYTFAKDAANSLAFQGEVEEVRAKTDDLNGVYSVKSVITYELDEFIDFVNDYVYKDVAITNGENDANVYKTYNCADKPIEYDAKINELLFAFSTDSGSLNTYKGYVIKPAVDGADSEEYVKTFGDAGRQLLYDAANNGYKSSYKIVASDYGYHFMFFSEVWNAGDGYATLADYLNSLGIVDGEKTAEEWASYFDTQKEDWEKFAEDNSFLYILANELVSEKLSDKSSQSKTAIITEYRYGEHKDSTVIYKDRFSDLLG